MTTKGLFFGSFNPIHNGHLEIANFFLRNKYLSEIIFIVTPQNPLKLKNENLSFKKRLRAVEIATKNISKIRFSDVESKLTFPNYTSDTLKFLRAENPPCIWQTFLYPISFNVFVARADLPPAAQNKTISLLGSMIPF